MPTESKDYALVVGIDDYSGTDFSPLKGAKNDARAFVAWLKSQTAGNLGAQQPLVLLSQTGRNYPRKDDVNNAVKQLMATAPTGQPIGRRLYIFMAGHGVAPDLDEVGLVMADASDAYPSYYPGRLLANLFRGQALFDQIVVCMDCCRDYDLELEAPSLAFKRRIDPALARNVQVAFLFGTEFGKKTREKKFGARVHGIFSRAIITGLAGEAADGEGRVTGASLKRHVRKFVEQHRPTGVEQLPRLECPDDFVFVTGLPPRSAIVGITLTDARYGVQVLDGGNRLLPVTARWLNATGQERRCELPVGKIYVLQEVDDQGQPTGRITSVSLADGEGQHAQF